MAAGSPASRSRSAVSFCETTSAEGRPARTQRCRTARRTAWRFRPAPPCSFLFDVGRSEHLAHCGVGRGSLDVGHDLHVGEIAPQDLDGRQGRVEQQHGRLQPALFDLLDAVRQDGPHHAEAVLRLFVDEHEAPRNGVFIGLFQQLLRGLPHRREPADARRGRRGVDRLLPGRLAHPRP